MTRWTIDLNADMGEFATQEAQATEAALMPLVTSCSIACGGHAGDETTMRTTARLARQHKVNAGAHPSYPDRENFGRRSLTIEPERLMQSLRRQIAALEHVLAGEDMRLSHVKAHGALYNDAARDIALARIVAGAAKSSRLIGPPNSALERAAKEAGVAFLAEGFVDRLYLASGALTPRSEKGAVISDMAARSRQALALASGEEYTARDGSLRLNVATLCIHSDSPGAVETATAVRKALSARHIDIKAPV